MNWETLDASPTSDLDWETQQAEKNIYHLNFGWDLLNPFDEALFNSHYLAVEEFGRKFPDETEVILAVSDGDFSKLIAPSDLFDQRLKESGKSHEIFSAQLFSEYLHHVASALPTDCTPVTSFDISDAQFADMVIRLCRRRFEHFKVVFSMCCIPIEGDQPVIVSLPQDEKYDSTRFEKIFRNLKGHPFKCIPEELLNEHWDEVEEIIYDPESISDVGSRMLLGFEAAGGAIKEAKF